MKNNYVIMGTMLPCNRLADTFDVDMPSCIICSSCGNELSKTLSEMRNSLSATAVVPLGGIWCLYIWNQNIQNKIFKYMIKFLRYIIPAIVECEVGLANLEAEFLQTHTVGGNNNSCICIWHWLPCKPCRVIINTVLLHKRMLTTRIKLGK